MGNLSSARGRGVPVAQKIRCWSGLAAGVKNAMAGGLFMQVALIVALSLMTPAALALDNLESAVCVKEAGQIVCTGNNGVNCSTVSPTEASCTGARMGTLSCGLTVTGYLDSAHCEPDRHNVVCNSFGDELRYDNCWENNPGLNVDLPAGRLEFPEIHMGGQSALLTIQPRIYSPFNFNCPVITITNVSVEADDFRVISDACDAELACDWGRCELQVVFNPRAKGLRTGNLRIETDSPSGDLIIPLVGTGVGTSNGTFGSSLSYAPLPATPVDIASEGYVYIWQEGASPLGYAIALTSDEFQLLNDECQGILPPATFCALKIRFTPAYEGNRSAVVTFSGDGFSAQDTLVGQGLARIVSLSASQGSFDFRSWTLGSPATAHLRIVNDGTLDATINSIGIDPTAGKFTISNASACLRTLAPADSCELTLAFDSAQPGLWIATLNIDSSSPASPLQIALSGRALATFTTATASVAKLKVGRVPVGARSAAQTVTLTNTGPYPLWAQSSADVSLGTCSSPVAPGGQCTVLVSAIASGGVFSVPIAIPVNTATGSISVQILGLGDASTCP